MKAFHLKVPIRAIRKLHFESAYRITRFGNVSDVISICFRIQTFDLLSNSNVRYDSEEEQLVPKVCSKKLFGIAELAYSISP